MILPKQKTNDEFVRDLMMFSRRGAIIQPFVLQALKTFSEMVITQHKSGELAEKMKTNWFVSADAWADCAREILEKMEAQYGPIKADIESER